MLCLLLFPHPENKSETKAVPLPRITPRGYVGVIKKENNRRGWGGWQKLKSAGGSKTTLSGYILIF